MLMSYSCVSFHLALDFGDSGPRVCVGESAQLEILPNKIVTRCRWRHMKIIMVHVSRVMTLLATISDNAAGRTVAFVPLIRDPYSLLIKYSIRFMRGERILRTYKTITSDKDRIFLLKK